jgi:hypothetical protein
MGDRNHDTAISLLYRHKEWLCSQKEAAIPKYAVGHELQELNQAMMLLGYDGFNLGCPDCRRHLLDVAYQMTLKYCP